MTTNRHTVDVLLRRAAPVRDADLAPVVDPQTRQALMTDIVAMPRDQTAPPRRSRRRPVVAFGGVLVAGLAVAGWAYFQDVAETTEVACHIPDAVSIVDSVTGDPVADCAALWRRDVGGEPPALVAYNNGHGGIDVRPATSKAPAGGTALAPGFTQNARLIELEASLGDYVEGLPASCRDTASGTAVVQADMSRLGITGWTIESRNANADGNATCTAYLGLDRDARKVIIDARPPRPAGAPLPFERLAAALRRDYPGTCRDLDAAAKLVRDRAKSLGIDEPAREIVIHRVVDSAASCTRIDMNVGGTIEVTLRGPS